MDRVGSGQIGTDQIEGGRQELLSEPKFATQVFTDLQNRFLNFLYRDLARVMPGVDSGERWEILVQNFSNRLFYWFDEVVGSGMTVQEFERIYRGNAGLQMIVEEISGAPVDDIQTFIRSCLGFECIRKTPKVVEGKADKCYRRIEEVSGIVRVAAKNVRTAVGQ